MDAILQQQSILNKNELYLCTSFGSTIIINLCKYFIVVQILSRFCLLLNTKTVYLIILYVKHVRPKPQIRWTRARRPNYDVSLSCKNSMNVNRSLGSISRSPTVLFFEVLSICFKRDIIYPSFK